MQPITINGSDPEGMGALLLRPPQTWISVNVTSILDGSRPDDAALSVCNMLGGLSCADAKSMRLVPRSEKETLLRGVVGRIRSDATASCWLMRGKLTPIGQGLADSVVGWCKCPFVVECNLGEHGPDLDMLGALVEVISSLHRVTPHEEVIELLVGTLNLMSTSVVHYMNRGMSPILKSRAFALALELDTWLLTGEIFRHFAFVVSLAKDDLRSLRKVFLPGKPSRIALESAAQRAALGKNRLNPGARLVAELFELAFEIEKGAAKANPICRKCSKTSFQVGAKLSICSKCHNAYYCSKDCQTADWALHKKICCKRADGADGGDMKSLRAMVQMRFESNMHGIRRDLGKALAASPALHFTDFAVVVSLEAGAAGAGFQVCPVNDWLGRAKNFPSGWFYPGTEVYEDKVNDFLEGLRVVQSAMTAEQILVVAKGPSGVVCFRLRLENPTVDLWLSESAVRLTGAMSDVEYNLRVVQVIKRGEAFAASNPGV